MRIKILLLSFLISSLMASAQCPTDDLSLLSQAEVDDFSANYPNCTMLTNELIVESMGGIMITNLDGLSEITHAEHLVIKNTEISNYSGLENLEVVTHLTLWGNANTTSLEGLTSLMISNKLELFFNNGMTNLSGIDNLNSIDFINIFGNTALEDISDLSFLTSLNQLTIGGNNLSNLMGLQNLETVFGDILISNDALTNLNELSGLQNVSGSLYISNNAILEDISALSNIQTLFNLYVVETPNLVNLDGLENIISIPGTLRIGYNTSLTNLAIFSNLVVVGDLDIYENENLTSLSGLENLTQIDRTLLILNNPNLTDILSLDNVSPFTIDEFAIANNASLSVCDSELICALISDSSIVKTIQNNGLDCNSIQEVEAMCLLGVDDVILATQIKVVPNPVVSSFEIQLPSYLLLNMVEIYTVTGSKVMATTTSRVASDQLPSGVYFIKIFTNRGVATKKLVKK